MCSIAVHGELTSALCSHMHRWAKEEGFGIRKWTDCRISWTLRAKRCRQHHKHRDHGDFTSHMLKSSSTSAEQHWPQEVLLLTQLQLQHLPPSMSILKPD